MSETKVCPVCESIYPDYEDGFICCPDPNDEQWIVHSEKQMHLPALSDSCVICLTETVAAQKSIIARMWDGWSPRYDNVNDQWVWDKTYAPSQPMTPEQAEMMPARV